MKRITTLAIWIGHYVLSDNVRFQTISEITCRLELAFATTVDTIDPQAPYSTTFIQPFHLTQSPH